MVCLWIKNLTANAFIVVDHAVWAQPLRS